MQFKISWLWINWIRKKKRKKKYHRVGKKLFRLRQSCFHKLILNLAKIPISIFVTRLLTQKIRFLFKLFKTCFALMQLKKPCYTRFKCDIATKGIFFIACRFKIHNLVHRCPLICITVKASTISFRIKKI